MTFFSDLGYKVVSFIPSQLLFAPCICIVYCFRQINNITGLKLSLHINKWCSVGSSEWANLLLQKCLFYSRKRNISLQKWTVSLHYSWKLLWSKIWQTKSPYRIDCKQCNMNLNGDHGFIVCPYEFKRR